MVGHTTKVMEVQEMSICSSVMLYDLVFFLLIVYKYIYNISMLTFLEGHLNQTVVFQFNQNQNFKRENFLVFLFMLFYVHMVEWASAN